MSVAISMFGHSVSFKRSTYNRHLNASRLAVEFKANEVKSISQHLASEDDNEGWSHALIDSDFKYEENTYIMCQVVTGDINDETNFDLGDTVQAGTYHLISQQLGGNVTHASPGLYHNVSSVIRLTNLLKYA